MSSTELAVPAQEATKPTSGTSTPKSGTAAASKEKVPPVSHGRGGAANINPDDAPYADGTIVREGLVGDQGDGAFSTGRGGAANIGSPGLKPTNKGDAEIIPETALRDDRHEVFHTGRGGEGNLHTETPRNSTSNDGKTTTQTKADKVEGKISEKAKETNERRRSLFGRVKGGEKKDEKKVEGQEAGSGEKEKDKEGKKVEREKKHPPPTHSGLGDRLKYKLFGRLWD